MKQQELYRKPDPPGYLGHYKWRATVVGLLSLVLVSSFATEYIANKFSYQPALGAPLLRVGRFALYEPLAWVIWGWEYATTPDPRVRRPFFEGEMIVLIGSFLSIGLFYAVRTAVHGSYLPTRTIYTALPAGPIQTM